MIRALASLLLIGHLMPLAVPALCTGEHEVHAAPCEDSAGAELTWALQSADPACEACTATQCESVVRCTGSVTANVEERVRPFARPALDRVDPESVRRALSLSIPPPSQPPRL